MSDHLLAAPHLSDDLPASFDYLIARTSRDNITFLILQGYSSILLFADSPSASTPAAK